MIDHSFMGLVNLWAARCMLSCRLAASGVLTSCGMAGAGGAGGADVAVTSLPTAGGSSGSEEEGRHSPGLPQFLSKASKLAKG